MQIHVANRLEDIPDMEREVFDAELGFEYLPSICDEARSRGQPRCRLRSPENPYRVLSRTRAAKLFVRIPRKLSRNLSSELDRTSHVSPACAGR